MTAKNRASIEEVRALAAKHGPTLREVFNDLMSSSEPTLDEHMSFYRGDDYSPGELREIAAEAIDARYRCLKEDDPPEPDPVLDRNIKLIMKLAMAAIGQDLPEDREELETAGWLYLQVLEAAAARG